jgi:hypothetical protein
MFVRICVWSVSFSHSLTLSAYCSQYQLQLKSASVTQKLLASIRRAETIRSGSHSELPVCWKVTQKTRLFRLYLDMFNTQSFGELFQGEETPSAEHHLSVPVAPTSSPSVLDLEEPDDAYPLTDL